MAAELAIEKQARRKPAAYDQVRSYHCPCGKWHLTTRRK